MPGARAAVEKGMAALLVSGRMGRVVLPCFVSFDVYDAPPPEFVHSLSLFLSSFFCVTLHEFLERCLFLVSVSCFAYMRCVTAVAAVSGFGSCMTPCATILLTVWYRNLGCLRATLPGTGVKCCSFVSFSQPDGTSAWVKNDSLPCAAFFVFVLGAISLRGMYIVAPLLLFVTSSKRIRESVCRLRWLSIPVLRLEGAARRWCGDLCPFVFCGGGVFALSPWLEHVADLQQSCFRLRAVVQRLLWV